jgi:hypothetical protein
MKDQSRRRFCAWLGLLLVATLGIAACVGARTPATSTPRASVAPPPAPSPSAGALPSSSAAGACTAESLAVATDELIAAIGNPDTAAPSEASEALENALATGDPAAIDQAAAVVLEHLAQALDVISAGPSGGDERLAIACREWTEMIGHIEDATELTRAGGVGGSDEQVEAGRTLQQSALMDHFWQGVKANDPTMYIEHTREGWTASASRARLGAGPAQAFDGSTETYWMTGDALAPQWVQVELGWPATISGVRVTTFQDADGVTDHSVLIGSTEASLAELTSFVGETGDRDVLVYVAPEPLKDVGILRVVTNRSAGPIGWREIEVVLAAGSSPPACDASETPLLGVTALDGSTSSAGPGAAVDGDPATAWDPGPERPLLLTLAQPSLVSSVRILIGEVPAGAQGWTASVSTALGPRELGRLALDGAVDGWLAIPGPAPCVAVTGLQFVSPNAPNPPIREVQILGVPAPQG